MPKPKAAEKFEVVWGRKQGRKFPTLEAAIPFAHDKSKDVIGSPAVIPIYDESGCVVAIAIDDANGCRVVSIEDARRLD
jgi:hypothetical protein